jgi:DegV family protein with EDD domain
MIEQGAMKTQIVTDSGCDLPDQLTEDLGVTVVPMTVRFGDEELLSGVELSTPAFWERCARSPTLPETAAPSPGAFQAAFEAAGDRGADGVVCVCMSGALSATQEAARVAAEAVSGHLAVRVIDSRSISMGEGLIVIGASRTAAEGQSLEAVASVATDLVGRTRFYGTMATLEYLRRGGRIGPAAAVFGSLLSFKPVIVLSDGAVQAESRQRTRARSLRYLVDKLRQHLPVEQVAVVHGQASDLDEFLDLVGQVVPRASVLVADLGPTIGTHSGPGSIGLTFQVAVQ